MPSKRHGLFLFLPVGRVTRQTHKPGQTPCPIFLPQMIVLSLFFMNMGEILSLRLSASASLAAAAPRAPARDRSRKDSSCRRSSGLKYNLFLPGNGTVFQTDSYYSLSGSKT